MTRARLIGLGLRLSIAGGRPAWMRVGLMAAGLAVGSGLLLAAMSVVPALEARDARAEAIYGDTVPVRRADDALLVWYSTQRLGTESFTVYGVEPVGDAPTPPGLTRIPRAGEMFVSDGLAQLTGAEDQLERRLGVRVVGRLGSEAVEGPGTLAAWMGRSSGSDLHLRDADALRSFGAVDQGAARLDLEALVTLVGIGAAVLLPIWLFVATATRLSAATREARFAAVRLAGATHGEVRLLAAVEAGSAAAIGSILGIPLFMAMRPVLASGVILDLRFYATDFSPPPSFAVALVFALPLIAVTMALVSIRRLRVSPLGVARRARRRHAGWGWSLVLTAGVSLLAWSASQHAALAQRGSAEATLILFAALALTTFGLVGTATWSSWLAARWLATRVSSASLLLGMRRLESDPTSVGRVVGGVALIIALVPVLQSGLIASAQSFPGTWLPRWTRGLPSDTVLADTTVRAGWRQLPRLVELEGVRSVDVTKRQPHGGNSSWRTGVITTDGSAAALEAIRQRLAWTADVFTVAELREESAEDDTAAEYRSISRGLWLLTVFLLLVNAATLMVAMIDWIVERRRSLAMLSAIGASKAVLQRSILAQVALPLFTSVLLGTIGGVVVVSLLYTAVETEVTLSFGDLATLVAAVTTVVLAVTALSTPWMRVVRSPELLRGE